MQEQITSVSMKTPSACTKPWLDGWCGTGVAAAAMFGAEPMPASLENSPRLTPFSIAAATPPATPPAASWKPKAEPTMCASMPGTSVRWVTST